ncbi:MAG TPA: DUF805 domain-containing protein [Ohtaekwangia sp.]
MNIKQLTTWSGEINRRDYLIWGTILFAVKYNLDRLAGFAFNKRWYISDYFIQADQLAVQELNPDDQIFYLVLLLLSLPFIWFGTVLCVKRLRNAKLPAWAVLFFFIPFINLLLFLILSAIPERKDGNEIRNNFLDRLIPRSKYGSALFAVGIVLVISLAITGLLINYLNDYGWSLFVGIPFFLGFGSVLIYGYHKGLRYKEAMGVALASILFFNIIIFILAFEGIICIVMGFPILLFIAWIGASIGYAIHDSQKVVHLNAFAVPIVFIPLMGFIENLENRMPPTVDVTSEIVIDAPRQQVWDQLVAFSRIDEPIELIFKTGIAYPIHAEIEGTGVGAVRKCNFTTGAFIEPILIWDEPSLLQFGVHDQPPPMMELSIYNDLEIAHLDGYFKSVKGQFKLEELPNGQTRLQGTTWYHHDIWPSLYWKQWSDYILHKIHLRVLKHIKAKAEDKK